MKRPSLLKASLFASSLFIGGLLLRCFLWIHSAGIIGGSEQKVVLTVYLENIYYPTYARLDGLLAGVLLAAISLFRPGWWRRIQSRPKLLFSSGTICLSISIWICREMHSFSTAVIGFPLLALSFGLLLISSLTWDNIPMRRITSAIATLAYSIYLTHKPIIHLVHQYGSPFIHHSVLLLLTYPLSILAGAAMLHFCVERPFLQSRGGIVRPSLISSINRDNDRPNLSSASALAGD
jgi:peptidoglycan/LPS O-acetylase OafA/YrhL